MESVVSSTTVTCLIVVAALLVIAAVVGGILAYKFWKNTAAREQKFKDELNDDTPWGEYPFDIPDFAHTGICPAVHRICSHGLYSIPDLLRMNNFCCEVTIAHRKTVEQDYAPLGWWKNCSYDVFACKLRAEAEHRPPHLRYGQFIYCRTFELFPDVACKINASADCFNDDTKVGDYLHSLYKLLRAEG